MITINSDGSKQKMTVINIKYGYLYLHTYIPYNG